MANERSSQRRKRQRLGLPDLTTRQTPAPPARAAGAKDEPASQPDPQVNQAAWYALSDDGASALRVRSGMRIGESPTGALLFNDDQPGRFSLTLAQQADGAWWVETGNADLRLVPEDGDAVSRYPLTNGLTLGFPNNTLCLSDDIRKPASAGPSLAVRAPEAHRNPEARRAMPATPERSENRRPARRARPKLPLVTWGLVVAALAVGAWWVSDTRPWLVPVQPPADTAVSAAEEATVAAAEDTAAGVEDLATSESVAVPEIDGMPEAGTVPEADTAAVADNVTPPVAPIDLASLPQHRRPSVPSAQDQAAVEQRGPVTTTPDRFAPTLARARDLLEAGYITYPPGNNAVALLSRIVAQQPGHEQAMAMLAECTHRLLDAALAAREQGLDYEARNLVEEVRGFNPDNERARQLMQEWSR